jgi:large subunit ribosomal protein L21
MASYAVIETGGKQYRVEKGSTLLVDRLSAREGDKIDLPAVAFRDKEMVLGKDLEKVKVEAKVAGHERGPKVRVFKYRPKKGYRRRAGHRSELTRLEITDVKMLSRRPAASSGTRKKPAPKKEDGDGS